MATREYNIPHIDRLLDIAAAQCVSAINDALRHAQAHLAIDADHPSNEVVRQELFTRIRARMAEMEPAPPDPNLERANERSDAEFDSGK